MALAIPFLIAPVAALLLVAYGAWRSLARVYAETHADWLRFPRRRQLDQQQPRNEDAELLRPVLPEGAKL